MVNGPLLWAQSASQNYVMSMTARHEISGSLFSQRGNQSAVQTDITYIDGLGRTLQQVMQEASPGGQDVVKRYTYDPLGRADKDYLPYEAGTNNGTFQSGSDAALTNFYTTPPSGVANVSYPYSQTLFESSPLNRPIESSSPGTPWRSSAVGGTHVVDYDYLFNVANEIRLFAVDNSEEQNLTYSGFYTANQLRGKVITDEDNKTMLEYTDKAGKVVCKINALGTSDETYTYYIYDDYDRLAFVIPPEAVVQLGTNWSLLNDVAFRKRWLFRYKYDQRNRMIEKQVPGAAMVEMVYDKRDRLVFTLDGNRRAIGSASSSVQFVESGTLEVDTYDNKSYVRAPGARIILKKPGFRASKTDNFSVEKAASALPSNWLYTKYDVLNRPVITGIKTMTATRASLQAAINNNVNYDFSVDYIGSASGNFYGYDNTSYPSSVGTQILTVTYYDNYDFVSDFNWSAYQHSGAQTAAQGLVTGGRTLLLGTSNMLNSATWYDDRYRVKAVYSENYFGGIDRVVNTYRNNVSPLVSQTVTTHRNGTAVTTVTEAFTYDHRDRLLTHTHRINSGPTVTLTENTFNAIGQLIEKDLHNPTNPVQSVDYTYNERGWLKTINGGSGTFDDQQTDQFGMELKYNDAPNAQYNGNIGQLLWKAKGGGYTEASQNYQYTYDPLNRLTGANYSGSGNFDVSNITYDKNGNILTLQRDTIDNLDYDYLGNQLTRVEDAASNTAGFIDVNSAVGTQEYQYDSNGNMTSDANKGITNIEYNYLNLPEQVTLDNGDIIHYTYDAAGIKHAKTVDDGSPETTAYVGGFHYLNGDLKFLQHAEGRALKSGTTWNYEYNLTDHLGNVRVSVNESGDVVQRDGYYPFGMAFNSSATSPKNNYLFNQGEDIGTKAERQPELGVDFTAFRVYDPALGRFWQVDPKADQVNQEGWSPFQYAFNNPILYNDPLGDTVRVTGSDEFVAQYEADRAKVAESEEGQELLKYLDESPNDINISEATTLKDDILTFFGLEGDTDEKNLKSSVTTQSVSGDVNLEYSQVDDVEISGAISESHHTLNHELNHAKDFLNGTTAHEVTQDHNLKTAFVNGETRAVQSTNRIRAREGKPLRTEYKFPNGTVIKIPIEK